MSDNGVFALFKWQALFERWPDLLWAFGQTVAISLLALVIALLLGLIFGIFSVSRSPLSRGIARIYVETVQNIPLLLQVFVLYAIFPLLGFSMSTFFIGVTAVGIYHGGYIAEVVRSGVGSIHRGQFEAAKSQGFGYWQMMLVIILPQAIRIILPPLAVQTANLVKNTSVLALIAGGELMYFTNSFAYSTSYYGPAYVVTAILYFIICFPLSRLAKRLEDSTHRSHIATGDALDVDPTGVTPGVHDITGHASSDTMGAGIDVMQKTIDINPPPAAPSPRHPLHPIMDPLPGYESPDTTESDESASTESDGIATDNTTTDGTAADDAAGSGVPDNDDEKEVR